MPKHLGNTLLAVRPLLPAVALAGLLACSGTGGPRASHPRPATTVNEPVATTVPEPPASEHFVTAMALLAHGRLGRDVAALEQAVALATDHDFQVLLTDSVMSPKSGRAVAQRIDELRPGRRVVYMSGYGNGGLGPHLAVPEGAVLLQKPFTRDALLAKVAATAGSRPG